MDKLYLSSYLDMCGPMPLAARDHPASRKTNPPLAATKLTRRHNAKKETETTKRPGFFFGATQQRQSSQRQGLHSQCLMYSISNLLSYTPPGYNVMPVAPALAPVICDTPCLCKSSEGAQTRGNRGAG